MNLQDSILAGRYAKALYEAATAAKAVEAVGGDLEALAQGFKKGPALRASLLHPRLSAAQKKSAALQAAGKSAFHGLTDRFIDLLLEKKRPSLLPLAASLFQGYADAAAGLSRAQVRAAQPLTPAQLKSLSASLEKALKTKVALETSVDASLLGGVVVRSGDKLWDLSLAGRLKRMKEKLLETSLN